MITYLLVARDRLRRFYIGLRKKSEKLCQVKNPRIWFINPVRDELEQLIIVVDQIPIERAPTLADLVLTRELRDSFVACEKRLDLLALETDDVPEAW